MKTIQVHSVIGTTLECCNLFCGVKSSIIGSFCFIYIGDGLLVTPGNPQRCDSMIAIVLQRKLSRAWELDN